MTGVALAERPWLRFYEPGVPPTLTYPSIPVHALLDDTAARFPDRPATVFFGATLTFRRLQDLSIRFAAGLAALGVRPGDRVSLHLPNCPQFLIAYYGALRVGAVVVPFNPLYVEREIEHQLTDSGAEVAVTLDLLYPRLEAVRSRTRVREMVITRIHDYFPPLLRALYPLRAWREGHRVRVPAGPAIRRFADLLEAGRPAPAVAVDPAQTAVLLYTGGTTGVPKGAMLSHRNLVSNVLQARAWFTRLRPGQDTTLAVIPFFHSYGMTAAMNFSVSTGTRLVLLPRFQVDMVLQAIARYRPQIFPGVPTIYTALISHPQVRRYDLRSISACISGAAPLPVEVQTRFEELTGGRLVEGYGLTEASPVTHANPLFGTRKAGSIGIPFPDTDARILDDAGRTLPPGEVGELAVRGPQVMQGYWNRPDETAQVLREGWLLTGDMARMDEDGYFYIVDRKKEMIITGGLNVFPREVEEVLYTHPAVLEAAVVGTPDPYKGEVVKAFVVLRPGARATAEEIIEHCRRHLAPFKVPRAVEFRPQLPKSLIGKILRRVLAEEERARAQAR
ncbi:MAG: long-chain fatty acid--CoA ligase [Armatimonadota bacterium]|nr:long-chain fatty acid--CoA ligase [Armatimonadota bacterium]